MEGLVFLQPSGSVRLFHAIGWIYFHWHYCYYLPNAEYCDVWSLLMHYHYVNINQPHSYICRLRVWRPPYDCLLLRHDMVDRSRGPGFARNVFMHTGDRTGEILFLKWKTISERTWTGRIRILDCRTLKWMRFVKVCKSEVSNLPRSAGWTMIRNFVDTDSSTLLTTSISGKNTHLILLLRE